VNSRNALASANYIVLHDDGVEWIFRLYSV
jgi:hypothetical protein